MRDMLQADKVSNQFQRKKMNTVIIVTQPKGTPHSMMNPYFIPNQYKQILRLLHKILIIDSVANISGIVVIPAHSSRLNNICT